MGAKSSKWATCPQDQCVIDCDPKSYLDYCCDWCWKVDRNTYQNPYDKNNHRTGTLFRHTAHYHYPPPGLNPRATINVGNASSPTTECAATATPTPTPTPTPTLSASQIAALESQAETKTQSGFVTVRVHGVPMNTTEVSAAAVAGSLYPSVASVSVSGFQTLGA